MNLLYDLIFELINIEEYLFSIIGILSLTTIIVTFSELDKSIVTFSLAIISSLILKLFDYNTIPNIFIAYFFVSSITLFYNTYNYINVMDVQIEKLSKVIQKFSKESLYLDILYSEDKIDIEYLLSYFKIKINDITPEKKKNYIDNLNKIILLQNIKLCDKQKIFTRISQFLEYVKKQKGLETNSITMNGFAPSNSLIKFYIKLIVIKRNMIPNINNSHNKFNDFVSNSILRFGNKFNADELIEMTNLEPIPKYKETDENFKIVIDETILGIEKYFNAYAKNNMFFF